VPGEPRVENYTPHDRKIPSYKPPAPENRLLHGSKLKTELDTAQQEALQRRESLDIQVHGAIPGLYIEFQSQPDISLKLDSLENRRQGIELVAFRSKPTADSEPGDIESATVFVPEGKLKYFVAKFDQYAHDTPRQKGERRYEDMIDRISSLRIGTLRALWTDAVGSFPAGNERIWWEVWLRRHDGKEFERLSEFAGRLGLLLNNRRLQFEDRIVTLIQATSAELSTSLDVLNDLAEVREAKESAAIFVEMPAEEQADWLRELRNRIVLPSDVAPAVCILDTGVNRNHPLLENSLNSVDCHSCDPIWGNSDHHGHGTEMAGLALYGDLTPLLAGSESLRVRHQLESVKILPPRGENRPELYGAITAEATSRVEIQAPDRKRCFSMAITSGDQHDRGQPTSWSAAIDALAAGRAFDPSSQGLIYFDDRSERRLFVLSAGNVSMIEAQYLDRSDTEAVHDPAHAWNALTVGAHTEKANIEDPSLDGWLPLAKPGDLSPHSTTSVVFQDQWPVKPDLVFEGGNVAINGTGDTDSAIPELNLLTTYFKPHNKSFVITNATSAASAQVARMAGIIASEYPDYWPETVRGLLVHSAEWTRRMKSYLAGAGGKQARSRLVRRYGFGVPHVDRALHSAKDALTLIVQNTLHPFSKGKMREMHLHQLPWPKDVLESLGETSVRLKVTLSYFIEPNPGRRGWQRRHRYASHGYRFEVKSPTESLDEFRKRLNKRALEDNEEKPATASDSSDWYLGEKARNHGSLHSDIWVGTAADLAERGAIGIYPISGWWKDQPKHDRSEIGARYSLVVSIETEAQDVDIWTPVANEIGVSIEAIPI
jgi:hypothetical protein